jgi:hypothetical protein
MRYGGGVTVAVGCLSGPGPRPTAVASVPMLALLHMSDRQIPSRLSIAPSGSAHPARRSVPRSVTFALTGALLLGLIVAGVVSPGPRSRASAVTKVTDPRSLLPRPFVLEQTITGDLDKDGDLDVVVVGVDGPATLKELTPESGDGNRVLVVAQKVAGGYVAAGTGFNALLCRACGGAFWGINPAPVDLSVAKGVLTVQQSAGSREVTTWTHKYRIEAGRVRLIGVDITDVDRLNGATVVVSTNLLTGLTITTVEGEPEEPVKAGTRKGRPTTVLLAKVSLF